MIHEALSYHGAAYLHYTESSVLLAFSFWLMLFGLWLLAYGFWLAALAWFLAFGSLRSRGFWFLELAMASILPGTTRSPRVHSTTTSSALPYLVPY